MSPFCFGYSEVNSNLFFELYIIGKRLFKKYLYIDLRKEATTNSYPSFIVSSSIKLMLLFLKRTSSIFAKSPVALLFNTSVWRLFFVSWKPDKNSISSFNIS